MFLLYFTYRHRHAEYVTERSDILSDTILRTFPKNEFEAIAYAYIQSKDLSSMTPEEAYKLFKETKKSIYQYATNHKDDEWMRIH